MTSTLDDDRLTAVFAALANPTRRAILERLADGQANVGELAEPFDMTLPAISRHLRVLEQAGLITRGHQAQYRPCVIDPAPLERVATWTEQYRPLWEDRLDRLGDYLSELREQADT